MLVEITLVSLMVLCPLVYSNLSPKAMEFLRMLSLSGLIAI